MTKTIPRRTCPQVLLGADERPHGMGALSDDERRVGPYGDYLDDSGAQHSGPIRLTCGAGRAEVHPVDPMHAPLPRLRACSPPPSPPAAPTGQRLPSGWVCVPQWRATSPTCTTCAWVGVWGDARRRRACAAVYVTPPAVSTALVSHHE